MIKKRKCKSLHTCKGFVLDLTVRDCFLRGDEPRLGQDNCELNDGIDGPSLSEVSQGFCNAVDLNLENFAWEATEWVIVSSCDSPTSKDLRSNFSLVVKPDGEVFFTLERECLAGTVLGAFGENKRMYGP